MTTGPAFRDRLRDATYSCRCGRFAGGTREAFDRHVDLAHTTVGATIAYGTPLYLKEGDTVDVDPRFLADDETLHGLGDLDGGGV